jgi:hypothetical protein
MNNMLEIIKNPDQLIPIRKQDQTATTQKLVIVIKHCFDLAGQKCDPFTLETAVKGVSKQIFSEYKSLSLEEIYFALEQGTLGKYDKYFGLNAVSFCKFIQAYNESDERLKIKEARLNSQMKQLNPVNELSENDKIQIIHNGCLDKFEIYKKTGFVDDMGNVSYSYLTNKGVLNYGNRLKWAMMEKAKGEVHTETIIKLNDIARLFERNVLKYKLEHPELVAKGEIQYKAMNIALNHFFKCLVRKHIELKNLIG